MDFSKPSNCIGCGHPMEMGGGNFSGRIASHMRWCDHCGMKALFYSCPEDFGVYLGPSYEREARVAEEHEEKFRAALTLAGFKFSTMWKLQNGYSSGIKHPWYLFGTEMGMIQIGWRKRVISVDWSTTKVAMVVPDNVTRGHNYFHAWGYEKLVEYLKLLKEAADEEGLNYAMGK